MTWQELGGISEVFYTHDRKFCFQRVGNYWRLYGDEDGHFIQEYRSFVAVQEHIMKARGTCPYNDPFEVVKKFKVCFIDGHDLKYKTFTCDAIDQKQAIEKMMDLFGSNFDHQITDVFMLEDQEEE